MLRRALLALLAVPLLAPAASATCVGYQCVTALDAPGSVEGWNPPPGTGVLCSYVKESAPPPSDWHGAPDSPPPYIFMRTQAWGDTTEHQYRKDWDYRVCLPACPPPPAPVPDVLCPW